MDRRQFMRTTATTAGILAAGPLRLPVAHATTAGVGPYGRLQAADANGIRLPRGFTSRIVAQTGMPVAGTTYIWHPAPDGGATYATPGGGWIYVSNSEVPAGGVSALRFGSRGKILDAYRILSGTAQNCSGGKTPWDTWLSCEEYPEGRVWECDPFAPSQGVVRPALGTFMHEAAAVDPVRRQLYLTEDLPDGRFYRFTPDAWPSLDSGRLEVAVYTRGPGANTTWREVPDPAGLPTPTRQQVPGSTAFNGGEVAHYFRGLVYFTTKGDNRVWRYEPAAGHLRIYYDDDAVQGTPLRGVDNITVARTGDVYIAEDGDNLQLCLITPTKVVAPFLQVLNQDNSEIAGPAFNPAGNRLYFSSQRGSNGQGITYEVRGPFRR